MLCLYTILQPVLLLLTLILDHHIIFFVRIFSGISYFVFVYIRYLFKAKSLEHTHTHSHTLFVNFEQNGKKAKSKRKKPKKINKNKLKTFKTRIENVIHLLLLVFCFDFCCFNVIVRCFRGLPFSTFDCFLYHFSLLYHYMQKKKKIGKIKQLKKTTTKIVRKKTERQKMDLFTSANTRIESYWQIEILDRKQSIY